MTTLSDLRSECSEPLSAEYRARYLHAVPAAPSVERVSYIVELCRGKRVLSLGASGPLDAAIRKAADVYHGVDKSAVGATHIDLDAIPNELMRFARIVDVVVCGEILEHLSNPGKLLDVLHCLRCPVVISVPNAFMEIGSSWLKKGIENVNDEHVAWYSYRTLKTLVERHGFRIIRWEWYNGPPMTAEGLIFEVE